MNYKLNTFNNRISSYFWDHSPYVLVAVGVGVEYAAASRFLAACRSNIALFHSGMSSSVCEVWGWVEEEVAPGVALDENDPISAPIRLGRWALFSKNWICIHLVTGKMNEWITFIRPI